MVANKVNERKTKYCRQIEQILSGVHHATNAELLAYLRKSYPKLSATTVHRATARLANRNIIAIAPSDSEGSMRYDSNIIPHDHFECSSCGLLMDAILKDKIIPILESSIEGCHVSGRVVIKGICKKCIIKEEKK